MYLTYLEYNLMGGALDAAAFNVLNRKAEYVVRSQANGRTGKRIDELSEVPQAVKDCIFELINHLSQNRFDGTMVKSESQSLGGQSESYTYVTLTKEEVDNETEGIIFNYLSTVEKNGVSILYRGACV